MIQKIVGVTELQRSFRPIFDEVAKENVPYVLMRGSRPEAALIPYQAFVEFMAYQEQLANVKFEQMAAEITRLNRNFSDEEISADIEAAITEARSKDS